ncbi:hypothetical protein DPEC_G00376700 [Dallia pectoralis]|nr:hypothetical protein DPEC_G00376700 [Dallia pectoralis]
MEYTGKGDVHQCYSCNLIVGNYVPGDTFLNQHAYFTGGECPYLKANYTLDRLKIEIGQARFLMGSVAHPRPMAIRNPWTPGMAEQTTPINVTLADDDWCYMCGRLPHDHGLGCSQRSL